VNGGYIGSTDRFWELLHRVDADTVVLCGDLEPEVFESVVEASCAAGCHVLAASRHHGVARPRPGLVWNNGLPFVEISVPALRASQLLVKRVIDVTIAAAGLLLLAPVMGLIALAIKLDSPGPALFRQDRVGYGGRLFRMLKFRTMRDGADAEKGAVAHLNHTGDPRLFKIPDDPRVTRLGRWLRRWSLDELPQLWNVLVGEMSLVGPRPFFESDLRAYSDHHLGRLGAKPGITGWWQVKGRSAVVDFEEVVRLDREYIDQWSLWLDLKILLRTIPVVVSRSGAF
jgi:exopolysaccharide biosynthesis polyprenyl glycosylphosphotransferase